MSGEMPDFYMGDELPADANLLPTETPDASSTNYAFNSGFLKLNLSAEEQTNLMASIEAIFQSEEESPNEDQAMADADDEEPMVDLEDQQRRTDKLKSILPTLAQLWWCRSEQMDLVTEKLADRCRNRESGPFCPIDHDVEAITSALSSSFVPWTSMLFRPWIIFAFEDLSDCLVSKMASTTRRFWNS